MFSIHASGSEELIRAAWEVLAWSDPTPASAVDAKKDSRTVWQLNAYADTQSLADACKAMIVEAAPALNARIEELAPRDWVTVSLEGLPSVEAGSFIVAGDHALAASSPGKTAVLIEAGPAFGTGHHGTTLGCLLAYEKMRQRGHRPGIVLDIGSGSGVLAIAALKTGASRALGTDIDADSVRVAAENSAKNHVAAQFKSILCSGVRSKIVRDGAPYNTVFANILSRPLVGLAPDIEAVTAPGGVIILSGLLTHQEPQVRAAYAGRGLVLTDRIRRDGWSTLIFTKAKTRRPHPDQWLARRAQRAPRRARSRGRPSDGPAIVSFTASTGAVTSFTHGSV